MPMVKENPLVGRAVCKAKFFGPTNTKGSRYRVVPVRGEVQIEGVPLTKPRTIPKDYRFSLIYDQMESLGLVCLFDDEATGWSYFAEGERLEP